MTTTNGEGRRASPTDLARLVARGPAGRGNTIADLLPVAEREALVELARLLAHDADPASPGESQ